MIARYVHVGFFYTFDESILGFFYAGIFGDIKKSERAANEVTGVMATLLAPESTS
jgi:hypothetical protein